MAKGSIAKEKVEQKIIEAFGDDFVGISDKKLYVWAEENGERIQVALTLTCPKVMIEGGSKPVVTSIADSQELNFETMDTIVETPPVIISEDEKKNIEELMARLNL